MPTPKHTVPKDPLPELSQLPQAGLIQVSGHDAVAFLNGQLSQEISADNTDRAPLAAWHDANGRVLAVVRVLAVNDVWLLLTHGGDPHDLIRRLSLFVLRADVTLEDVSSQWRCVALLGDTDRWLNDRGIRPGPASGETATQEDLISVRGGPEIVYLLAPTASIERIEAELPLADAAVGALAELRLGLPNITAELAKRYTPQMLNLDRLGALAFDKGCYPGQEVIARTHNLGSVKRRVSRYSGELTGVPAAGTKILDRAGNSVGEVIRASRAENQRVELLAIVRTDSAAGPLVCEDGSGTPLRKEPLPGE